MSTELFTFIGSAKLPCTHYVAAWLLDRLGLVPPVEEAHRAGAWRAMDQALWEAVNIYDRADPWSGPPHVAARFGVEVVAGTSYAYEALPHVPPDRWGYVQRWWPGYTNGHAYLVRGDGGGGAVVHDTTEDRGYRAMRSGRWCPPGYLYRLVLLEGP